MKYLRYGLTLFFSLLLAAAAQAQAQQASARVIVHPDGLDIRLNDQARWNAATSWPGALRVAQDVINELERSCSGCYQIDRGRLAFQISYHAAGSYLPNEWVQRHANPVNVTWPELAPPDWRALNRGLRGIRNGVRSPFGMSQQREPPDRQRLSPRTAEAIRSIERSLVEAQERDRREGGRTGGGPRDAAPTRDNTPTETKSWHDRLIERMDRRPD